MSWLSGPLFIPSLVTLGVLACVLSVLSALLERCSPIRLSQWAEEAGGRLSRLYDSRRHFEAFRYLLTVLAVSLPILILWVLWINDRWQGTAQSGSVFVRLWPWLLLPAGTALVELLNRHLVRGDPESALQRLTWVYRVFLLLLLPLVHLLAGLMRAASYDRRDEDEDDEPSDQALEAFIDVGTREGILDSDESEMVRSVVDFGETRVRSIMTPRIDIICAPVSSSLDDLASLLAESTHTRIPIYEGSIDQIVGVLHLRDLLRGLLAETRPETRNLVKSVWFVPESRLLGEVLKELQERRQQMAVVVDEYGGTSGLVTIEDLLEEIVGDIVDQDEDFPPQVEHLPDGSWRLDGRIRVDDLDKIFGLELEDGSFDTVGGMLFSTFGYVPVKGESTELEGLRFTIEEVGERRIQTVLAQRVDSAEERGE